jgi:hypothetical protein
LIEVQCIKKIVQLPIFLQLSQFDVVLPFQFWLSDGGSKTGIVLSCQEEKSYNIGMASPSPNQLDSSMWSIVLKVQGWTHLSQRARPVPSEKLASMQFLYFIPYFLSLIYMLSPYGKTTSPLSIFFTHSTSALSHLSFSFLPSYFLTHFFPLLTIFSLKPQLYSIVTWNCLAPLKPL